MKPKLYIPAFTGIRAIAAFCVFFHHYNQKGFPYPIFRVLNDFHLGVSMLFVLSGFLICYKYYEQSDIGWTWMKVYMNNRMARVYPMYFLISVIAFLVAFGQHDDAIYKGCKDYGWVIFVNLTFLKGFFNDLKFTGIAQGWSMTVEECFYFSAPFIFFFVKKSKKYLVIIPLLLLAAGWLSTSIFSQTDKLYGFLNRFEFVYIYTFLGRGLDFFLGIGLAFIITSQPKYNTFNFLSTFIGLSIMLLAVAIMATVPLNEHIHYGLHTVEGMLANNLVLPIGVFIFFYGLATENTWINKLLSTSFFQQLGKSSYCFYLIHIGFFASFVSEWVNLGIENWLDWLDDHEYFFIKKCFDHVSINIIILFMLFNIAAYVLWRFIEEPLHRYIRNAMNVKNARFKNV